MADDVGDLDPVADDVVLLRRVPPRNIDRDEAGHWKRWPDGKLRIKPQAFDESSDGSPMSTLIASDGAADRLLDEAGDEREFCAIVSFRVKDARDLHLLIFRDDPNDPSHVAVAVAERWTKTIQKALVGKTDIEQEPLTPGWVA